jgi:hypothetical protein
MSVGVLSRVKAVKGAGVYSLIRLLSWAGVFAGAEVTRMILSAMTESFTVTALPVRDLSGLTRTPSAVRVMEPCADTRWNDRRIRSARKICLYGMDANNEKISVYWVSWFQKRLFHPKLDV